MGLKLGVAGAVVVVLTSAATAAVACAQSVLIGSARVADTRAVVGAAEISIGGTDSRTLSDSSGMFRLGGIARRAQWVVLHAYGFETDSTLVDFTRADTVVREFRLRPVATSLPRVNVTARPAERSAKLAGFEDRRRTGVGRFLDRSEIAKWDTHRTEDMLQSLPGVTIFRSQTKASPASGRAISSNKCAFCKESRQDVLDPLDYNEGAPLACYMDVYVDGAMVYSSTSRQAPLFDVNSIPTAEIDAVEVYLSAAQIPAAYNKTSGGCGVMLIWTRVR